MPLIDFKHKNKIHVAPNKICIVNGCTNKITGRHKEYCPKHYYELYRYGHIRERNLQTKNEIIKHKDYAEIVIYNRYCNKICTTKIDLDDVERCSKYKWRLVKNYIRYNNKAYLHHFILTNNINYNYIGNNLVIDHINRDTLDNRKCNLRIVTISDNNINRTNKSRGYDKLPSGRYRARISINNKNVHLGVFDTKEGAVAAYNLALSKYHNIKRYEKDNA